MIPKDMKDEPPDAVAWWTRLARQRGAYLRPLLERGVEWQQLERVLEPLAADKRAAFRAYIRQARPMVIRMPGEKAVRLPPDSPFRKTCDGRLPGDRRPLPRVTCGFIGSECQPKCAGCGEPLGDFGYCDPCDDIGPWASEEDLAD